MGAAGMCSSMETASWRSGGETSHLIHLPVLAELLAPSVHFSLEPHELVMLSPTAGPSCMLGFQQSDVGS